MMELKAIKAWCSYRSAMAAKWSAIGIDVVQAIKQTVQKQGKGGDSGASCHRQLHNKKTRKE